MKRLLPALLGLTLGALLPSQARAYVIPPEPLLDLGGGVEALTGVWTASVSAELKTTKPSSIFSPGRAEPWQVVANHA